MLERVHLHNLGPAPKMEMHLAARLSLITGDNGLGKSFLLDAAWWSLTGTWPSTWPGAGIRPSLESKLRPWIGFTEVLADGPTLGGATFDFEAQEWSRAYDGIPSSRHRDALVLYARADGGFSLWDKSRSGQAQRLPRRELKSSAFQFSPTDVWEGLASDSNGGRLCEGLLRDVVLWQLEAKSAPFEAMAKAVATLAEEEGIRLTRDRQPFSINDSREAPVLDTPYGPVPVVVASAAVRRVLAFAYVLVWLVNEHDKARRLQRLERAPELVVLIDEVEQHLHPKWQRTFLRAVMNAANASGLPTQFIVSTHSPLILASLEQDFDEEQDTLLHLDLRGQDVVLENVPWAKQGDVVNWLVSDAFGLRQGRSKEAEVAIEAAEAFMRGDTASLPKQLSTKDAIHAELRHVLAGHDEFWPRWIVQSAAERSTKKPKKEKPSGQKKSKKKAKKR